MLIVNIHEAKTHLSNLLERAAKGEPFIIAKAGKPPVKVVPLAETGVSSRAPWEIQRWMRSMSFANNGSLPLGMAGGLPSCALTWAINLLDSGLPGTTPALPLLPLSSRAA